MHQISNFAIEFPVSWMFISLINIQETGNSIAKFDLKT